MLFDIDNIDDYYLSDVTSDRLIHPLTKIVDFNLNYHSKEKILQRIQFWKNFLKAKKVQKISLHDHLSIDSIALLFACLEQSVTIHTCQKSSKTLLALSTEVDVVILGESSLDLYSDLPNYYLIPDIINNKTELPVYVPDRIDIQSVFLVGKTSGTSGPPKIIKHTARTFINASIISTFFYKPGKCFSAYPNINHIGMAAVMCCAPALAGTTIYSCRSIHDLMFLISRQIFDIVGLFAVQTEQWQNFEQALKEQLTVLQYSMNFGQAELITAGSSPSPTMADWFFSKNGKRIRSFYGSNETLSPNFVIDINSPCHDFSKRSLGKQIPGTDYKINDDNILLVKNPGVSDFIECANGWYNTGDYVVESDGELCYKGRKKINNRYLLDFHDIVHHHTFKDGVEIDHYLINYENNMIDIYAKHQFAINSINSSLEEIEKNIKEIDCNLSVRCSIINDTGTLEIKSVPARDSRDYL